MEFLLVKVEVLERCGTLRVVPRVGEEYSSDIPEEGANQRQEMDPPDGKVLERV
jgi:hypothetical protein